MKRKVVWTIFLGVAIVALVGYAMTQTDSGTATSSAFSGPPSTPLVTDAPLAPAVPVLPPLPNPPADAKPATPPAPPEPEPQKPQ